MQNYKIWMKKAGSLFLCCILSGVGCISCNNAKSSIQTKQTENTQSGFSCGSGELTDIANYIGSPVKLRYIQDGETHNECEITDKQTIDSCMNALQTLQIGKEIEVRAMDAGETFLFEFKDGSVFVLSFESGNLLKNGVCYETKGYTMLQQLIKNNYEKNVSPRLRIRYHEIKYKKIPRVHGLN